MTRRVPPVPPFPDLDASQRAVVDHEGGPLLVLAGPGTGKTTTLVAAVAERVRRGADPERLLVLTDRRRAAADLRDALADRLGGRPAPRPTTFHSYCYALLRAHQDRDRFSTPLRLLTGPEQDLQVRELLAGHAGPAPAAGRPRWPDELRAALTTRGFADEVRAVLARTRELGLGPAELAAFAARDGRPDWAAAADFLGEYLDVLGLQGAVDYAELAHRAVPLARLHADDHDAVFVDEFQDIDAAQLRLLRALAGQGRTLVAFGDPDQSVYAFRGADLGGILDFPSHFRGADGRPAPVRVLSACHRTGPRLLAAARLLAERMPLGRLPAPVVRAHRAPAAAGGDPGRVEVLTFPTAGAETDNVADLLRRAHLEDGLPWREMAVLVRAGSRSLPALRRTLTSAGVPVEIDGDDLPLHREPAIAPLLTALRAAARAALPKPPPARSDGGVAVPGDAAGTPDGADAVAPGTRPGSGGAAAPADGAGSVAGSPRPGGPAVADGVSAAEARQAVAPAGRGVPRDESVAGDAVAGESGAGAALSGDSVRGGADGGEAGAAVPLPGDAGAAESVSRNAEGGEFLPGEAGSLDPLSGDADAGEFLPGEAGAGESVPPDVEGGEPVRREPVPGEATAGEPVPGEAGAAGFPEPAPDGGVSAEPPPEGGGFAEPAPEGGEIPGPEAHGAGAVPEWLGVEDALTLLVSPLGGLDAAELRRLGRALREWARAAGAAVPPPSDRLLAEALADPERLDGLDLPEARGARRLAGLLADARRALAAGGTAEDALWLLWDGTPWPQRLEWAALRGGPAGRNADRDLDAVCALFETAARAEERSGRRGALNFLDELEAQDIAADVLTPRPVRPEAVLLTTAHRARGRQWRLVVVAGVQEGLWPDLRRRGSLLEADRIGRQGLAPPLPAGALLAEERRLFYVAVTRARQRLVVTAVQDPADDGDQPSRFLAELGVEPRQVTGRPRRPLSVTALVAELRATTVDPDASEALRRAAAERLARLAALTDDQDHPLVPAAHPDRWWGLAEPTRAAAPLREADRPVALTGSALGQLADDCSLQWFLGREVRADRPPNAAQGFGNLLHVLADEVSARRAPARLEVLMARLDAVWDALAFDAPWKSRQERDQARAALERFLRWHVMERGREPVDSERAFEVTLRAGEYAVEVRGSIDRVERDGEGRIYVVDFKTGRSAPTAGQVARNPQLAVYQLALRDLDPDARLGGAELVHLRQGAAERAGGDALPRVQTQPPLPERDAAQPAVGAEPAAGAEAAAEAGEPAPGAAEPGSGGDWPSALLATAAARVLEERFAPNPGQQCAHCAFRGCCSARPEGRQVVE